MAWRCDDCKPFWSWVEIPTRTQIFFSLIFVRIHTNEFIQLLYELYSTNSYKVWFLYQFIHFFILIVQYEFIQRAARGEARAARAKPEHTTCPDQAAPGCPDVNTRLPRRQGTPGCPNVRVHSAAPTSQGAYMGGLGQKWDQDYHPKNEIIRFHSNGIQSTPFHSCPVNSKLRVSFSA